jgi:hypothetical protein
MEPVEAAGGQATSLELAPEPGAAPFSVGGALSDAWRAWSRNFWPLTGTLMLLRLPSMVLYLAWVPVRDERGVRPLLELVLRVASALVAATALAVGGLDALGGRRPSIGSLLRQGIASSGRLFAASVRAFPWGTGAALIWWVTYYAMGSRGSLSRGVMGAVSFGWLAATGVLLINLPISWVRVFPLPALLIEEPERTTGELVQRARELTLGRRWRVLPLFLTGVLVSSVETALEYPVSASPLPSHQVAHTLVSLFSVVVDVFVEILPAVAYFHLRGGQEAKVAELSQVFE